MRTMLPALAAAGALWCCGTPSASGRTSGRGPVKPAAGEPATTDAATPKTTPRSDRLVFPEKSFTQADSAKLNEWLNELKTYGAQGAPDGKPMWGLSEAQFKVIYSALGARVETEVEDLSLTDAVAKIGIPRNYPQ